MAQAAVALEAAQTASKEASDITRQIISALEHPIYSYSKVTTKTNAKGNKTVTINQNFNVTTGLVLGGIGLGLLWEVAYSFASAIAKDTSLLNPVNDVESLIGWILTNFDPNQKPQTNQTFGKTLNANMTILTNNLFAILNPALGIGTQAVGNTLQNILTQMQKQGI
jgi:hypothetical protein